MLYAGATNILRSWEERDNTSQKKTVLQQQHPIQSLHMFSVTLTAELADDISLRHTVLNSSSRSLTLTNPLTLPFPYSLLRSCYEIIFRLP